MVRFVVDFIAVYPGRAIEMGNRSIGISGVDYIREKTKCPGLDIERIKEEIRGVYEDRSITIPEEVARESGYFDKVNKIQVTVSPGRLNEFISMEVKTEMKKETGEILSARIDLCLNEEKVISEWEKAGFPLKWKA